MESYLKQIARHYCAGGDGISRVLFVVPSRRAIAFFRKSMGEIVAEGSLKPFVAPTVVAVNDFFRSLGSGRCLDRISLLVRLHRCWSELCRSKGQTCESLDDFLFWGDVILNDFSDVDKYLVDAKDLFRNVSDLKDMQDDYSDLEPKQLEAIRRFLGHFETKDAVKDKFASIWNLLGPLYESFNELLKKEGVCYDGALLRELSSSVKPGNAAELLQTAFPDCDRIVFCGLNVLCTAEKKILHGFKDAGIAEFSWDYVSDWIKDSGNRSSFFMEDNIKEFGQDVPLEKCGAQPEITVVSAPSAVAQTKLVSSMLADGSVGCDVGTAVVLPDETLLLPMLNSLPENVRKVNVTMGYPMASSSFFTLIRDLMRLQQNVRLKDGEPAFYHKYVWNIIDSNIVKALSDERTLGIFGRVKQEGKYYVPSSCFAGSPLAELMFKTGEIRKYLLDILYYIGGAIAADEKLKKAFAPELDMAMESVRQINLLSSEELDLQETTYMRLIEGALSSVSVPFKGEPLEGLQIMGPLETRALDFDSVIILSANEGVFPRSSLSPSFITHSLRYAFGLPTYVFQDAVWAYYFYRLIQRAGKLIMIYDSRTEGMKSGEESRYIKQLKYAFGNVAIKRKTAVSSPASVKEPEEIGKTPDDVQAIRGLEISASALKSYLSCKAQFYYRYVKRLSTLDEISESLDSGMMGTAFHESMRELYLPALKDGAVTERFLSGLLENRELTRRVVEAKVREQLNGADITGRNIILSRIIRDYVLKTLVRDKELLGEKGRMELFGLEKKCSCHFHGFSIKGIIDRLDSLEAGTVRIVDYKTGSVTALDRNITDENAEKAAEAVFGDGVKSRDRALIALQFFIYDLLLESSDDLKEYRGKDVRNSVYSIKEMFTKAPDSDRKCERFISIMKERLSALLDEMVSPTGKFERTQDTECCEVCDFKTLCAR